MLALVKIVDEQEGIILVSLKYLLEKHPTS